MKNPTRFQREINIAQKLDHPNVVRLYETFKDARKIYLVMELCTGGELFDRIVDEAPSGFDEAHAAKYIRQILSAICYLHAHRFAHRDVKPENFLFHDPSAESQLKIIDFGLACQFEPGVKMSTKAGTAYYVAPEVLKGGYDEKCDVWSAGVISFVLLCGFPPFAGDKDPEILKKVKTGTFEFRSPEWDPISQGAKNLITQMLTFDPSIRPTAEVVLLSPWLKFKGTPKPAPLSKDFVTRLSGFRAFSKLKKVALTALAQQLPDEKIDGLQKTFRSLDKNGDGTLSVEEIREAIVQQGLNPPKALEDDILQAIDCNGSGSLDYTEFLAATLDQKVYMQRDVCWAAFRIFDLDGDGKITREELGKARAPLFRKTSFLARACCSEGEVWDCIASLSSSRNLKLAGSFATGKIEKMIEEVDKDGDGAVDFEEFCAMMSTKASRPQSAAEAPAKRQRAKSSRGGQCS
ncbi:CPK2 [Symbiodinium sp. CCMP2592]|nr:CPK2 [Symbiodinium sp. CCMP2592]